MARDHGLEDLLRDDLEGLPFLIEKRMFGGLAWLLNGHLMLGASDRGMLVRLGKGLDGWALELDGVDPMLSAGRRMDGWVLVSADVYGDDALRARLIAAALAFNRTLAPK